MQFLTPLALLGGLLAIPIILLYMLRLRRQEVVISSTFLWQQILRDNEANTPWQRLRRNLLLLLQLLILAALVIALARPFITVPAVGAGQIVLLLDASASMNATDVDDGTRFDAAKREALDVVNTLRAGDTMTVIRVADIPEVLTPATRDRNVLTNAINNAQPSSASADWSGALTLAIGGAAEAEDFSVVIISDGGLGDPALLPEVPGEVSYIPVGQSSDNVAITALATRTRAGQPPQLFTQITNYGMQDTEIVYSLTVDGELYVSNFYTVPANDDIALVSERLPAGFNVIEASLTVPTTSTIPDHLSLDNRAWAVASDTTSRRVLLMTPGNLFLEQVLRSLPQAEGFRGNLERGVPRQPFDVYIFDRWLPPELPDGDLLIINPPRSTDLFTVGAEITQPGNIQVARNDPRAQYVDFSSVNILAFNEISNVDWATPLVSAAGGPLVLAGDVDGRQVAIFSFDIHNSDLPLQITWPVLMSNLMEWFSPQNVVSIPNGLTVGDALVVRPPLTAQIVAVSLPDGTRRELPVDRPAIVFAETGQVGLYTLEIVENGAVTQRQSFAVNLFDPQESAISPQASVQIGQMTVMPGEQEEIGQMEFWPLIALLALIILLVEWYVYQQRQRPPTIIRPQPRARAGSATR
ncbi:MAG TPA: BatA and WFA domain-containing protein [Spirillospora sp.]|nr:BatA and WFA domain-containing protein [Spirillospora sp.]